MYLEKYCGCYGTSNGRIRHTCTSLPTYELQIVHTCTHISMAYVCPSWCSLHSESVPFLSLYCFLGGGTLSYRTPVRTTSRQSWPWVDRTLSRTAVNRVMLGNLCHALVLKFWIELEEVWVTTLQSPQSTTHHMVLYSPHLLPATDQDPCWWVHMAKVHINFFRRKHRIWMAQSSGEKPLFWDNDVLVLSTS